MVQQAISGKAEDAASQQYVVFSIADEEYCIEILKVQEIIRKTPITWLPRRPDYIKGVINLRGEIIPIVDLRIKFGLPAEDYTKFTRILIGQIENRMCGMVVDNVAEVVTLQAEQIEKSPVTVSRSASAEYIVGIAKIDARVLILLDIARVLAVDEVLSLDDVSIGDLTEEQGQS